MDTRKLIDYAMDENGVEFRSQLYASIHDRVTAAIESKKQEISQNLVTQESVVNEGLMTHITLGKKVKNDEGGHDQEVHYKGEKIGHISSYSHRTGTRYGMRHDASNDLTAGSRSPKEAIDDLRQSHAEYLKSIKESVVNEGLMTHITLGKKVKNDEGGHDQEVHYKGEKIGHISSYSHRTGTRYGMRHDASNDLTAGSRSPKEAIDDLRQSHAEYLKSIKESSDDVESMEKNKDDEAKERKKSSFPSGKGPSIFSKDKSSSGGKTTSPKSGVTRHSSGDRY